MEEIKKLQEELQNMKSKDQTLKSYVFTAEDIVNRLASLIRTVIKDIILPMLPILPYVKPLFYKMFP